MVVYLAEMNAKFLGKIPVVVCHFGVAYPASVRDASSVAGGEASKRS